VCGSLYQRGDGELSQAHHGDAPPAQGRVLIVTQEFFPSTSVGALRPAKFCKYLPHFGWTPRVLTTTKDYCGSRDESLDAGMMSATEVIRAPMRPLPRLVQAPLDALQHCYHRWRGRSWLRQHTGAKVAAQSFWWADRALPDRGVPWIPDAIKAGRRALKECDCIYSTYPSGSAHHVALKLSGESGLPWIADFRDPWSFGTTVAGMSAWKRLLNRRAERASVHRCRFVVSTTEAITERFRQTYPDLDPAKFVTIRNGFDPEDFPSEEEITGQQAEGVFRAAYFGTLYLGRDPHGLLQALRQLLDAGIIDADRFRLDLYGPPPPEVAETIRPFGLEGVVHAAGFVPYREVLRLMCRSSLLVVIGSAETDHLCLATKLYEYLYARRPILALVPPGPIQQFITELGVGEALPGHDVEGISRHLAGWYQAFQAGRLEPPQVEIPENYNRRYQAGQLAGLLSKAKESRW